MAASLGLALGLGTTVSTTSCGGSGSGECGSCNMAYLHQCYADGPAGTECTDNSDADEACRQKLNDPNATGDPTPCGYMGTTGEMGDSATTAPWDDGSPDDTAGVDFCDDWDPASNVTLHQGVYHVDAAWLAQVVEDPRPLALCDGARLEKSGGGYKVSNASSGDLLYELGLRNNHIVLSVNGYSLNSYDDAATAMYELYHRGATVYELTYKTCGILCANHTRDYELD